MHMDDPPTDWHPQCSQQIDCAYKVMVAVQDVVFTTPQLWAQGADKFSFLHDRNRRMDHACAEGSRLIVHRSRLLEYAIKGPIDFYFSLTRMPQHPHEPVLHGAAVKIFDNVKDSWRRLLHVRNCLLRPEL